MNRNLVTTCFSKLSVPREGKDMGEELELLLAFYQLGERSDRKCCRVLIV